MSKYYEKIEEPVSTQRSYLMFESGIRAKETQEHTKSTQNSLGNLPKYESEFLNCPYCSEKMRFILNRDVSLGEPPPQQMECIVDLCDWFIPEYPQFLR